MLESIRNLGHEMEGETTEEQGQEQPPNDPPLDTNQHLVYDLEGDITEEQGQVHTSDETIAPWSPSPSKIFIKLCFTYGSTQRRKLPISSMLLQNTK